MTSVPTFNPGDPVLVEDVEDWFTWNFVYKANPTSQASTTSPASDPDLTFTVGAGEVYEMRACIFYDGNGGSQGISWQWAAPTGTFAWVWECKYNQSMVITNFPAASYTSLRIAGTTSSQTQEQCLILRANIQVGQASGAWAFQWCQYSSSATATTVLADSFMMLRRVA